MPVDIPITPIEKQSGPTVRPAYQGDLQSAAAVFAVNEIAMRRRMHPLTNVANTDEAAQTIGARADLQMLHEENPRQVWVAESAGEIVGIAAAAFRERYAHIAEHRGRHRQGRPRCAASAEYRPLVA